MNFTPRLKLLLFLLVAVLLASIANGQTTLPAYYSRDPAFDNALHEIIKQAGLDSTFQVGEDAHEQISFAVIDLGPNQPVFGGVNPGNFIYPASVYKIYVAMEVLKQAGAGQYSLHGKYVVSARNEVDKQKEILYDPRPLLKAGDTATIHYLLDLMITRSDNTAANCLIDIAGRPEINLTLLSNGWGGSEVTRKFLSRSLEDPGYNQVRSTETCALHAADFLYKMHSRTLVNSWVSMKLESYLGLQLDTGKLSTGLLPNAMFYHKTGWWADYTHDTGIVIQGDLRYIISIFVPLTEQRARPRLQEVAAKVHELIRARQPQR